MKDIKIHNYQTVSKYTHCSDTRAEMKMFLMVSVSVCACFVCFTDIYHVSDVGIWIWYSRIAIQNTIFILNWNKNGFCIAYQMALALVSNGIATISSSTTMKAISYNKYINRISHESFVCDKKKYEYRHDYALKWQCFSHLEFT